MRNIVILNSLHFSYPLPILMRVSYNTLIVKQNTSDYYKYKHKIGNLTTIGPPISAFTLNSPTTPSSERKFPTVLIRSKALFQLSLQPKTSTDYVYHHWNYADGDAVWLSIT